MTDKYVHLGGKEDQIDQFEECEKAHVLLAAEAEHHSATVDCCQSDDDDGNEPNVPKQIQVII